MLPNVALIFSALLLDIANKPGSRQHLKKIHNNSSEACSYSGRNILTENLKPNFYGWSHTCVLAEKNRNKLGPSLFLKEKQEQEEVDQVERESSTAGQ